MCFCPTNLGESNLRLLCTPILAREIWSDRHLDTCGEIVWNQNGLAEKWSANLKYFSGFSDAAMSIETQHPARRFQNTGRSFYFKHNWHKLSPRFASLSPKKGAISLNSPAYRPILLLRMWLIWKVTYLHDTKVEHKTSLTIASTLWKKAGFPKHRKPMETWKHEEGVPASTLRDSISWPISSPWRWMKEQKTRWAKSWRDKTRKPFSHVLLLKLADSMLSLSLKTLRYSMSKSWQPASPLKAMSCASWMSHACRPDMAPVRRSKQSILLNSSFDLVIHIRLCQFVDT